jgi:hypothetical protein
VVSQRIECCRQTDLSNAQVTWTTQISPHLARLAKIGDGSSRITVMQRQGGASRRGTGPDDRAWKPSGVALQRGLQSGSVATGHRRWGWRSNCQHLGCRDRAGVARFAWSRGNRYSGGFHSRW